MTELIQDAVLDSAQPISEALLGIYQGAQGGFRVADVSLTYQDSGVGITVSPELPGATREDLYEHFIDAFSAAGWGFSSRLNRESTYRMSMHFTHPRLLTRTG